MCSETRRRVSVKVMKLLHLQLLSFCLLGCSLLGLTSCHEEKRRPSRYLIPDGYVGWVRIDYKVKEAPALPIEEGFYLIKFPPDGHLRTSTPNEYGWATDEYYYYSDSDRKPLKATGWGGGGMIWGGFTGSLQGADGTYEGVFVGTEEQFKSLGVNSKDENGRPKVGPIPH